MITPTQISAAVIRVGVIFVLKKSLRNKFKMFKNKNKNLIPYHLSGDGT